MRARGLVTAALAALGLPVALWLGLRGADRPPPRPAAPGAVAPASSDALAPASSGAADPAHPAEIAAPADLAAAPADPVRADVLDVVPSGDGVGLRVIARSTGAPLPLAEVHALGAAELPAEDRARFAPGWELLRPGELERYEALLSERGRALRADENATLWLARPAGDLCLLARASGFVGAMRIDERAESPVRFLLEERAELSVRVLDARGAPLEGVPVVLRGRRWPGDDGDHARAISAPDGLARFPDAGWVLGSGRGAFWFAAADVVLAEPVQRRVLPDAPAGAPIELRLPPTGAVDVVLLDEGGARAARPVEVSISAAGATAARRIEIDALDGRARFPWVEAGLELDVQASRWPGRHDWFRSRAGGPGHAGQTAVIELVHANARSLALRLIDEAGAPIAGAKVGAVFALGPARHPASARTDGDGRLRLAVPLDWGSGPGGELHVLEESPGERGGRVRPLPELAPGVTALGDLCLEQAPLVAGGRVVDASGAGVPGARVRAGSLDAQADATGAFEVRGWMAEPNVALTCAGAGTSAEAHVANGATNALLVLAQVARVRGRALLPVGMGSDGIRVIAPHGAPGGKSAVVTGIRRDGSFELIGLAPAWREFRVDLGALPGWSNPAGLVQSAELRAGETLELPPFDLRGLAAPIEVRIADAEGAPVPHASAAYWRSQPAPGEKRRWATVEHGCLRLSGADAPYELALHAPGFALARLSGVAADCEVELAPALELRLLLCGIDGVPAASGRLCASIELDQVADGASVLPSVRSEATRQERFDARGEVRFRLPCGGTYRVTVGTPQGVPVQLARDADSEGRRVLELDVRGSGGTESVELWAEAESLRRLALQPRE